MNHLVIRIEDSFYDGPNFLRGYTSKTYINTDTDDDDLNIINDTYEPSSRYRRILYAIYQALMDYGCFHNYESVYICTSCVEIIHAIKRNYIQRWENVDWKDKYGFFIENFDIWKRIVEIIGNKELIVIDTNNYIGGI